MSDDEIRAMILAIIEEVDYDTYKNFLPEYAEDPEYAVQEMTLLISIVRKHMKSPANPGGCDNPTP